MPTPLPTSPRFTDGQQLTPRRLDGVRRDAHRAADEYARNHRVTPPAFSSRLPSPADTFIGIVRSGPPAGSGSGSGSDYTDARYWIDRAVPRQDLDQGELFDATVEDIPNLQQTVTATNLAELPADGSAGTHGVPVGTLVQVFRFRTRETDGSAGVDQYAFTWGGLPPGGVEYQVVMRLDAAGTVGWEYPTMH